MAKLSKRIKKIIEIIGSRSESPMDLKDALDLLKKIEGVKFDESVDAAINLGIDPKKSSAVRLFSI